MIRPDEGKVTIDGTDVRSMSRMELARKISYLPQRSSATRTTVFDSVLIGRRPHMNWSLSKKDMAITGDVIRTVGLEDLSMRYVDEISGGEFQKVQIARAIVQETKVLILDEPTSSLDIANQYTTMRLLIDTVRERKVCTIMTMHDINLASYYSDELIFMKGGMIVDQGPPSIMSSDVIKEVFGMDVEVIYHNGTPLVIPNLANNGRVKTHEHNK
jgi:iron complex transport system ATP-binding protein